MEQEEIRYTEISILTHAEAMEGVADALLALGAKGVVEERQPLQVRVIAYFPADEKLEERVRAIRQRISALEKQGLRIGPGTVGVRTVGAQAWSEAWKDQFSVQHIAPGLVIAPTWENYQSKGGECVVLLDPGAAFGTGGHATTRLCLRALVEHIRPGDRVADVGCGSGILAITAVLLGAQEVVGTDNDPAALAVARQNARRNGVESQLRLVEADLLPVARGRFDLIACNIVADEAIRLALDLRSLLKPGGCFICSGFNASMVPMVEDALARAGLRMVSTTGEEGWAACVAMRAAVGR
jgi:ribosomal protein L11 methyltransferase